MSPPAPSVTWAWAGLPRAGERLSGDLVLVEPTPPTARALVVDVGGHGAEAHAMAARIRDASPLAAATPAEVMSRVHAALKGTGAIAAALAVTVSGEPGALRLEYCGVGNVRIAFSFGPSSDEGRPGTLGEVLPSLRAQRVVLPPGGLACVFTDGVTSELSLGPELAGLSLRDVPPLLLRRHARRYDDATCLALRAEDPRDG
jgi:hypothetical protein